VNGTLAEEVKIGLVKEVNGKLIEELKIELVEEAKCE
jgi:hypothetical protein